MSQKGLIETSLAIECQKKLNAEKDLMKSHLSNYFNDIRDPRLEHNTVKDKLEGEIGPDMYRQNLIVTRNKPWLGNMGLARPMF